MAEETWVIRLSAALIGSETFLLLHRFSYYFGVDCPPSLALVLLVLLNTWCYEIATKNRARRCKINGCTN